MEIWKLEQHKKPTVLKKKFLLKKSGLSNLLEFLM